MVTGRASAGGQTEPSPFLNLDSTMDRTKHQDDGGTRDTPRHSGSQRPPEEAPRPAGPGSTRPPDRDPEEEGSAGKRQV